MKTTNINILLSQLLQRLEEQEKVPLSKKVFVGFDGFIDRIKKPVKRRNEGEIVYYETLREFAERIGQAAGKSGQIELITKKIKSFLPDGLIISCKTPSQILLERGRFTQSTKASKVLPMTALRMSDIIAEVLI